MLILNRKFISHVKYLRRKYSVPELHPLFLLLSIPTLLEFIFCLINDRVYFVNTIFFENTMVLMELNRLMFNKGGPRCSKKRLLVLAVLSVVLYAAPALGDLRNTEK